MSIVTEMEIRMSKSIKQCVKALDENMNEIIVEGEELLARALQHEIDHLSGTLYVSKTENGIQDVEPIE